MFHPVFQCTFRNMHLSILHDIFYQNQYIANHMLQDYLSFSQFLQDKCLQWGRLHQIAQQREVTGVASDFAKIVETLTGDILADPIAEIDRIVGDIDRTFTTLTGELGTATSSISSISSSITGPDGLISKINGFGGTITTLTNSITSLTSGFSSIFGITLTDFVDDRMIEPSFVVTEIEEAEIETIATYADT